MTAAMIIVFDLAVLGFAAWQIAACVRTHRHVRAGRLIQQRFDELEVEMHTYLDQLVAQYDTASEEQKAITVRLVEDWMRRADRVFADSIAWQRRDL